MVRSITAKIVSLLKTIVSLSKMIVTMREKIVFVTEMIASEEKKAVRWTEKIVCFVQVIATFVGRTATSTEMIATSTETIVKIDHPCKTLNLIWLTRSLDSRLRHGSDRPGLSDDCLRDGCNLLRDKPYLQCDEDNQVQRVADRQQSEHDRLRHEVDWDRHVLSRDGPGLIAAGSASH